MGLVLCDTRHFSLLESYVKRLHGSQQYGIRFVL